MSGSDSNSLLVEDGPDVMRMDTVQQEREHASLFFCGADQTNAGNRGNGFSGIGQQLVLMRSYVVHPEAIHILDGCAQTDGTRHMGRACLKLVGQLVVNRLLEGYGTDHVAAALIRRHGIQQSRFAVQNADASWTVQL